MYSALFARVTQLLRLILLFIKDNFFQTKSYTLESDWKELEAVCIV